MSKVTKKELGQLCIDNEKAIARLESILKENGIERQPQLKQLDHSIFDGLDEKWRFAAFNTPSNSPILFSVKPHESMYGKWYAVLDCDEYMVLDELEGVYEYTDDWQNSLIERDTEKELVEVDLSSELTGSELCRAMLARGDTRIMCIVSDENTRQDLTHVIRAYGDGKFHTKANRWTYATPINNQGEPLTASEVGL